MKELMMNQFIHLYFIMFVYEFSVYFVLCHSFKLKTSKRKAYLLAFLFANFLPVTDALSALFVGENIIPYSESVFIVLKIFNILEELIIIAFIVTVFEMAWYRIYWLHIILHAFLVIPYSAIYWGQFTGVVNHAFYIYPMTLSRLPGYLLAVIVSIAWGGIFLLLSRFIRKFKKVKQISKWMWLAIYSGWFFAVMTSNKSYSPEESNDILQGIDNMNKILLLIVVIVIIMFLSINYTDKRLLKLENSLLKEQNEIQYANYLRLQQQEMEIHKLYHDIGNHIKTIQILVDHGENREARDYTESLVQQYQEIRKNIYCRNKIINAVLTQKLKTCEQSGITCDIDITIPEALSIRDIDLMSVYANLLDNAIEGCQRNVKSENYIKVRTSLVGDYFAVKIINSKSSERTLTKENHFETWKKDKSRHGYGLRILEEIVDRYDGQKEFLDNGEEFSAMIMLKAV